MHCTRQFSSLVPRFCLAAVELANEASSVGNDDVEYNDLTGQGLMNHHGAALISSWLDDSLRKGHTLVTVLFSNYRTSWSYNRTLQELCAVCKYE